MVNKIKTRVLLFLIILIPALIGAGDLDISHRNPKNVTPALKPVLSYLSIRQQLPMANLISPAIPTAVVTISTTGAGNYSKQWGAFPDLWSTLLLTENLSFSGTISNSEMDSDNAFNFGSNLTTSWGHDSTKNYVAVGLNFLKGPDDFYYQNINISIDKKIVFHNWHVVAGFTKHINIVNINVQDNPQPADNFACEKTIQLNHFRVGIYKTINNFSFGLECTASPDIMGATLSTSTILP